MTNKFFTSEAVTEGHPDKVCDQISDAILDNFLLRDSRARVACECVITTGMVMVLGEISSQCSIDIPAVVRKTLARIGYTNADCGFDSNTCAILTSIDKQSPDIAVGVIKKDKSGFDTIGAGDQGMMFGFACDETSEYMPASITLANNIVRRLSYARKNGLVPDLLPDGKCQVTLEYNESGYASRCEAIVVSAQHRPESDIILLRNMITEHVINQVIPSNLIDNNTKIYINPTGRFALGGPMADTGLTGRKIICDTYGGWANHGGGAFSGKDPTKVDRSGAYMARYVAKNLVAAGYAHRCQIAVAYAIGMAHPLAISVETYGTSILPEAYIRDIVIREFDFRPAAIIDKLQLRNPIYEQTAAYGHFGRSDIDLPWEHIDMVDSLKKYL